MLMLLSVKSYFLRLSFFFINYSYYNVVLIGPPLFLNTIDFGCIFCLFPHEPGLSVSKTMTTIETNALPVQTLHINRPTLVIVRSNNKS